jgi:hypothetical protein
MLIRGAPQRRQSEGKRVAKRLSATPLIEETRIETSDVSRVPTLVPEARIESSLLLKTNLPRRFEPRKYGGQTHLSIAGYDVPGNDSTVRQLRAVPIWTHGVLVPGQTPARTND